MNVGFFVSAADVILEVEITSTKADAFIARYQRETGNVISPGSHFQIQENKWGGEYRIYFNAEPDLNDEFATLGIDVEQGARPYHQTRIFRVNNMEFFWALIAAGYRIGPN